MKAIPGPTQPLLVQIQSSARFSSLSNLSHKKLGVRVFHLFVHVLGLFLGFEP
jgi:hypothetical protein